MPKTKHTKFADLLSVRPAQEIALVLYRHLDPSEIARVRELLAGKEGPVTISELVVEVSNLGALERRDAEAA